MISLPVQVSKRSPKANSLSGAQHFFCATRDFARSDTAAHEGHHWERCVQCSSAPKPHPSGAEQNNEQYYLLLIVAPIKNRAVQSETHLMEHKLGFPATKRIHDYLRGRKSERQSKLVLDFVMNVPAVVLGWLELNGAATLAWSGVDVQGAQGSTGDKLFAGRGIATDQHLPVQTGAPTHRQTRT